MGNEVSIIIRVNDSEAQKLSKMAEVAKLTNREIVASGAATASELTRQQEQLNAMHARAMAEDLQRTRTHDEAIRQNTAALQSFKIKTLGDSVAAEIAAQEKIDRVHAAAIAEDITREKARAAAIIREREKVSIASAAQARSGAGALAGVAGIGIPSSLAIGAVIGAAEASTQARDFERIAHAIQAVTDNAAQTREQMAGLSKEANRLGTNVTVLAGAWAQFSASAKGTNLEGEKAQQIFLSVSEAAGKLNLTSDETEGALKAIAQMMSKGTVQAEELRGQLGDRLPGAVNIMARALGVSTAELGKMLQQGQVLADDALPKFAAELRKTFGTDATTRIDSTTASFTRLQNEIKLSAAAIGDDLNPTLGKFSEAAADALRAVREGDGKGYSPEFMKLFLPGFIPRELYRYVQQAKDNAQAAGELAKQSEALANVYKPDFLRGGGAFDASGVVPKAPERPTLAGADLLTSGQKPRSKQDLAEIEQLQRAIELTGKKTELEKVEWEILKGKYKDADAYVQSLARQAAMAKDAQNAQKIAAKEAAKDQKEADKDAEKALGLLLKKEETERRLTQQQMVQNEIDREQLAAGRTLTTSERELVELKLEGVSVSGTSLEHETKIGAELERQIRARQQIKQDADAAYASLEPRVKQGAARKDIRDAKSFGDIDSIGDAAKKEAEKATLAKVAALEQERQTKADVNKDYDAAELAAWQDLETEKTRITKEQNDARAALAQEQLSVVGGIFGNLADVAKSMGKDGFKAYKAFAIAQATASMFQGAVGAFAQASAAFPPPYGQILGGVAAASVVASGMAQIAQIKALNYEGGRRFGGPVSAHSLYEVVENREPEVFKSSEGRVWMIPGADGKVSPAKAAANAAAQSAGPKTEWKIINNAPGIRITPRGDTLTVDALPELMAMFESHVSERMLTNKGPMANAMETKFRIKAGSVR